MDATEQKAYELYGPGIASFIRHPEIGALIREAADTGLAADVVVGKLRNTAWWQNTQDSLRQWQITSIEDPAEAERQVQIAVNSLENMAAQFGLSISAGDLHSIGRDSLRFGWTPEEVQQVLVTHHDWTQVRKAPPGQMGDLVRRSREMATDYMVNVSDDTYNQLAQKWLSGKIDEGGVRSYMEGAARQRWSNNTQMMTQLDQGFTVRQMIDPLREQIAQTLEISPAAVDFNDSYFSKALNVTDENGQGRLMNQAEVAKLARQHDTFGYTNQGIAEGNQLANQIVQMFGARG